MRRGKKRSKNWSAYNAAQTTEKARFLSLLYELCDGVEQPIQTFGRPRVEMSDRLFACVYKAYSTFSTRRFMTDLSEAFTRRYIARMPCYNSIINFFDSEELTPYLKSLVIQSALPLKAVETDFAVDSSGLSSSRYTSWISAKGGRKIDARDWIKIHIVCGVKTHIVASAEITEAFVGDSTQFTRLVETTAKHFNISEISADKAYSSRSNLRGVEKLGAKPFIPFKKNAMLDGRNDSWNRMYHLYLMDQHAFFTHYHKRSNVETTFSMIKAKFGGKLLCRTLTGQVNEALCKILCHNICCLINSACELGVETTLWKDQAATAGISRSTVRLGEAQLTLF